MRGTHGFTVKCSINVDEEEVWDYLRLSDRDVDSLIESGHRLTKEDYEYAARCKLIDNQVTLEGGFNMIY